MAGQQQQQQFDRKQVGGSPNLRNRKWLRFKRPFAGEKFLRCFNDLTLNVVPKKGIIFLFIILLLFHKALIVFA